MYLVKVKIVFIYMHDVQSYQIEGVPLLSTQSEDRKSGNCFCLLISILI